MKKRNEEIEINVRRMKRTDSFTRVGNLIYDSDEYIYPDLFGEKKRDAMKIVRKLLNDPDSTFHWENYYVATYGGRIIGISAVHIKRIEWDSDAIRRTFSDLQMNTPRDFDLVCRAFEKTYGRDQSDNVKIRCVSVENAYQRCGVGTKMLAKIMEDHPNEPMELCVLTSNGAAIKLYKKFKFVKNRGERLGYGGRVERKVSCQDMIKKGKKVTDDPV